MTRSHIISAVAGALLANTCAAEPELLSYEDARTTLHEVSDSLKAAAAGVCRSKDEAHAAASLGLPDLSRHPSNSIRWAPHGSKPHRKLSGRSS